MQIILSEEIAKKKGRSLKEQLVQTWKEKATQPEYTLDKYWSFLLKKIHDVEGNKVIFWIIAFLKQKKNTVVHIR